MTPCYPGQFTYLNWSIHFDDPLLPYEGLREMDLDEQDGKNQCREEKWTRMRSEKVDKIMGREERGRMSGHVDTDDRFSFGWKSPYLQRASKTAPGPPFTPPEKRVLWIIKKTQINRPCTCGFVKVSKHARAAKSKIMIVARPARDLVWYIVPLFGWFAALFCCVTVAKLFRRRLRWCLLPRPLMNPVIHVFEDG